VTYDPCKLQLRAERLTHRSLAPKSRFLDDLDVLRSTSKAAGLSCLKNPAGCLETRPYSSAPLLEYVAGCGGRGKIISTEVRCRSASEVGLGGVAPSGGQASVYHLHPSVI
jgi:hypothetical protein